MIDHDTKCIFVHIPKTGGTSIEEAFGYSYSDLMYEKHLTPEEYVSEFGQDIWDSYFKFTFVRNPWDRMVSWLSYMQQISLSKDPNLTMECMLQKEDEWHIYGRQQKWLNVDYDFVGFFENLNEDFDTVCKLIGVKFKELPWYLKTEHDHYSKYYTAKTKSMVDVMEADVIKEFGYTFDDRYFCV